MRVLRRTPLDRRSDLELVLAIVSLTRDVFILELHFHTGAEDLVDDGVADALSHGILVRFLAADLVFEGEVHAPVQALGDLITQEQLHFIDVTAVVRIDDLVFSIEGGVERNHAPVGQCPAQLEGHVLVRGATLFIHPVPVDVELHTIG